MDNLALSAITHYCEQASKAAFACLWSSEKDGHSRESLRVMAIENLHKAADAAGYDLVKRVPVANAEPEAAE